MLTWPTFVLEKFGGDTMDDVRAEPRRTTGRGSPRHPSAPVAGGRRRRPTVGPPAHGLTGTDEAGSGGDD